MNPPVLQMTKVLGEKEKSVRLLKEESERIEVLDTLVAIFEINFDLPLLMNYENQMSD